MTRWFLVTLTIDFELDPGCRSPYSKYYVTPPCIIGCIDRQHSVDHHWVDRVVSILLLLILKQWDIISVILCLIIVTLIKQRCALYRINDVVMVVLF